MNKPRLRKLIKALRSKAGRSMFDISSFIKVPKGAMPPRQAFASGGTCGTTVCIIGLAATIDDGWRIDKRDPAGNDQFYPMFRNNKYPAMSFAEWAGIQVRDAGEICYPDSDLWYQNNRPNADVAADVLEHYVKTGKLEYVVKEAKR